MDKPTVRFNPCRYDGCMFMDVADDQKAARVALGRLYDAAPALLEALERIANMCGETKPSRVARAAIRAAKGEDSSR